MPPGQPTRQLSARFLIEPCGMTPARGRAPGRSLTGQALAAPAPAAAYPGQMKGQAGQADEQKAGHIEDRAGRRAGGVENKRDREQDGRDDGEHGMSFRSPGRNDGMRTPASVKREVISGSGRYAPVLLIRGGRGL